MEICVPIWKIFTLSGLIADILGFAILIWLGPPERVTISTWGYVRNKGFTPGPLTSTVRWLGVGLIFLGFVLQIVGAWVVAA